MACAIRIGDERECNGDNRHENQETNYQRGDAATDDVTANAQMRRGMPAREDPRRASRVDGPEDHSSDLTREGLSARIASGQSS